MCVIVGMKMIDWPWWVGFGEQISAAHSVLYRISSHLMNTRCHAANVIVFLSFLLYYHYCMFSEVPSRTLESSNVGFRELQYSDKCKDNTKFLRSHGDGPAFSNLQAQ